MPVIPPGPGPGPTILTFVGASGPHLQLGDLATWATALVALGALVAAFFAYRKQAEAARDLSQQVNLQSGQLKDQQEATHQQAEAVRQFTEQARIQRAALEDQQKVSAKQIEVMDAQLRELQQRTEAIERQQADAITVTSSRWGAPIPGVRPDPGPYTHMTRIANEWHRPIRNVACRMLPAPGDIMRVPALVGRSAATTGLAGHMNVLDPIPGQTTVDLVRAGQAAAFVFIYEITDYPDATVTVRFTDDAGLHWQIDPDLHLHKLDNRDDW
jgi:hypothetical protein